MQSEVVALQSEVVVPLRISVSRIRWTKVGSRVVELVRLRSVVALHSEVGLRSVVALHSEVVQSRPEVGLNSEVGLRSEVCLHSEVGLTVAGTLEAKDRRP